MAVYVLDHYYLAITVLVTTAYQLLGFAIAWTFQFDRSNFFILGYSETESFSALLTLLIGNEFHARNIVASVLVMVWATRIAGFLLYRVLQTGSDNRFDEIRRFTSSQCSKVWTVSLPLTILNSPAVSDTSRSGSNPAFGTSRDIAGIILWALGWLIETTADAQKFKYKMAKGKPKDKPIMTGLWKWSRHPPYFGEIMCWWGIWMLCLSPTTNGNLPSASKSAQYGAIVSPLFTLILLMFGSGIPTAEKPQAKRYFLMRHGDNAKDENARAWSNYKEYLRKTSILIPIPPIIYKPLPRLLKKTLLLDFPMYQFDEGKDGAAAIEESRGDSV
ncbi:DUF1295-domain-containing protein [Gymnopus androsaceus JB14]|uniref:DUF1295-domain-containing protein n=1 Tax=Gymnopus androsaceus JB14 TaxID=1447944 RepID=A0A6A4HPG3_9AGAR|nr:DUF1295-domain-containing protein [Gymnopus androsaceus JB14]